MVEIVLPPSCTERIIYVRNWWFASDFWPGTNPIFAKRTVAAGWKRLHEWAAESPQTAHWVLDIGCGSFPLPKTEDGTTKALESVDLARLTVRGKGSGLTTLVGVGGVATWSLVFKESRDLSVRGFRLTYESDTPSARSSGIDLQSVRYARLTDLVLDPVSFYGVRSIALGGGEVPSPGACQDLHVHSCNFIGPLHYEGPDDPEALMVADTTRVHIANSKFKGIHTVGLGLWRAVIDADVEGCEFDGPGYGCRVGRGCTDVRISGSQFACKDGLQAALDPDGVQNAPFASLLDVEYCKFSAHTSGDGVGISLYACDGVVVRGSSFKELQNGIVLGHNLDQPPPRNVRIEACTFEGLVATDVWAYRSDIFVQNHTGVAGGHVIAGCCFKNAGEYHAALTVATGLTEGAGVPADLAPGVWTALDIQFDPAHNTMCATDSTVASWTQFALSIEFWGINVSTAYPEGGDCCP